MKIEHFGETFAVFFDKERAFRFMLVVFDLHTL